MAAPQVFSEKAAISLRNPSARVVIWFCLPALVIGALVRMALLVQMPYGYFQSDTPDFLHTVWRWQESGEFGIHPRKTFLVPLAFAVPFACHVPALRFVPMAQHALGLLMIAAVGILCRLWFKHWKWFIVPVTLLVAIHPAILWYEHALMAEALFLDCTVFLALAATGFALRKTWVSFTVLCVVLVLEAGARPEGKLFFAFGLLLCVLILWRERRRCIVAATILAVLGLGTHLVTKTSQAGLLLYTSVVHLTPDHLKNAPGLEPFIAPIKQDMIARWKIHPSFPTAKDRSTVAHAVRAYLDSREPRKWKKEEIDKLCRKLALETCRRNWWRLPGHALHKFRYYSTDMPAVTFNQFWLWDKQLDSYEGDMPVTTFLSRGLFGFELRSFEEIQTFVKGNFDPDRLAWFDRLHESWHRAVNALHLPGREYPGYHEPGIPLHFVTATLGLLAIMVRRDVLWPLHFSWGGMLLGLAFVIVLTASVKARFRFVFEPFLIIYAFALLDCIWSWLTEWRHRTPSVSVV